MIKFIDLCAVCGGKGRFLMQKCPSCDGNGGVLVKPNKSISDLLEHNRTKLSEQQITLFELYKSGFSQEEIAKKMNIAKANVALLFYQIEKKLS